MNELINLFDDAIFEYQEVEYRVKTAKLVNLKAVIITDKKPFNFYDSEFKEFIENVRFVGKVSLTPVKVIVVQEPTVEVEKYVNVHHAEIMDANNRAVRISEKLEMMFNELSNGAPDDKKIKKADAMTKLSNAIVSSEMMRFKYLNLK